MLYPTGPSENIIRVIAIDPGTDTLGVAIIDVDFETYEQTLVFGHTFKASKDIKGYDDMCVMRGPKDARLLSHSRRLKELLVCTEPTIICAESPFLQRGKVNAYEALVECYAMLRATVWDYTPSMKLHRIDPITAKNYCGVSHIKTDKTHVEAAIRSLYAGRLGPGVDLNALDEHTFDAVAVGNALVRKFLLQEVIASTKKPKRKGKRRRRKKK